MPSSTLGICPLLLHDMSAPRSKVFLEINEFCARIARLEQRGNRWTITRFQETHASEKPEDASADLSAGIGAHAIASCLLRPADTSYHLATSDEARASVTSDAIRKFLASREDAIEGAWQLALTSAGEGPIGASGRGGHWLSAAASAESMARAQQWAGDFGASQPSRGAATFALLAATRRLLKSSGQNREVFVLELGRSASTLFVVSAAGVELLRRVSFCFEHVVESIATAVNLRMRGAAAKLLFNPKYDFSESAPGIGAKLADAALPFIAEAQAARNRELAGFFLSGLPTGQSWVGQRLAESLGLPWWKPAISAWIERAGLALDESLSQQAVEPEWLGLLGAVDLIQNGPQSAFPTWNDAGAARKVVEAPAPLEPPPAAEARDASEPVDKRGGKGRRAPAFPRPLSVEPVSSIEAAAALKNKAPARAIPSAGSSAPSEPGAPASAESIATAVPEKSKRRRIVGWVSLAATIAAVGALGGIYFKQVEKQKSIALMEKAAAEERAAANRDALREAEARAEEEAGARRRAEALAAEQIAQARAATEQVEREAAAREAAARRLLAARGSVRVVTEPAGATVAVGNYAPRQSPALIDDLRLGRYPVVISKDGFDDVTTEIEIRESEVADPGVIQLRRQAGSVSITSIPAGVAFDLRPAEGRLFVASDETRQGVTPAALPDLAPGEYILTYLREGWPRHSRRFTIENYRATSVEHRFVGAALRVSSEPAGATVLLNGVGIGTTPMALADVAPGELNLMLELPGYSTKKLTRVAEAEQLVDVAVRLELFNRLYSPSELDSTPQAIQTIQPQIASTPDRSGRRVVISFEVNLSGLPENAVVVEAPDEDSARRCLEALQEWRFTPAMADGRPVRTKVSLPFMIP